MILLTADQISKAFADRVLFTNCSLSINEGDKIGVVGINGTGKSTLLRIIAGLEACDQGQITRNRGLRLEYLPQLPDLPAGFTILQAVLHGHSPAMSVIREYEQAARELALHPDDTLRQDRLIRLSVRMDEANAWSLESEIKTILTQLGISDFLQTVDTLSGGQKKRVALAGVLANPADLLILDEPTNHLDPTTIAWLEQALTRYRGAILMVTHDRYFLERVTDIMLDIDQQSLFRYEANYENFLELKAERIEREQASELKRQNLLRRELAWIRRGAQARSTKQQARIDRFQALDSMESRSEDQSVQLVTAASRLGRKTISLEQVSKAYGDRVLFSDFSYIVSRSERLGLIGSNGCGKTTLLNLFAGRIKPDQGSRDAGITVKIGFFTQDSEPIDPDIRVIEYIREAAEIVQTEDGELNASQMCERFLFPPELQWTPVRKLSGGERRRLFLLKILMGAPNILLLDEPTNDLDITTLAVLEGYLEGFPGAVIVVSHDRYFLDRVVDRLLAFEPGGQIQQYEGDFSAYQERVQSQINRESLNQDRSSRSMAQINPTPASASADSRTVKPTMMKLKMSESIELDTIDVRIQEQESACNEIKRQMELVASDYVQLQKLTEELNVATAVYEQSVERWFYLKELVEQIEQQTK
ncbi:MAG: ABC-F family ATP-binding cassette domain-containing protein [Eubacteriales bacterium]|nr:ABC-F family ATP-binding cassette domain-containing protein [Eubacteriales bacterium]